MNKKLLVGIATGVVVIIIAGSVMLLGRDKKVSLEEVAIVNGGFETGDLTGWTVVEGEAFSEDAVTTKETFWGAEIPFYHEGNWHLYGLGYDEKIAENKVGKLKSTPFTLGGDGKITFKLGAGRDPEKCYLGVYLVEGDKLIAKQGNSEFADPGIADKSKYEKGLAYTNNYAEYELDLAEYLGQEMYIMIVDEDNDGDFGFINVDDIRTYYVDGVAEAQLPGEKKDKVRTFVEEAEAASPNEVANPGFETGSLAGWEVLEGNAFHHEGVTADTTWWAENIPYNRDGEYHFGIYNEGETGILRSTDFELGGSGWISFKLGGGKNPSECYVSIKDAESGEEVVRFGNSEFADVNFPDVEAGLRLANLVQYKANLSEHLGKKLYMEIVDKATADWGMLTFDSFYTYHEVEPAEGVVAKNIK